jgi:glycosyltransferase involved in cell wall biosynthesis
MTEKVDLVMWTKNGAATIGPVLARIGEVIPSEFVNKRLIIDDQSTDNTRQIATSLGWTVIFNAGTGISDGANTALKNVETKYFVSFEQDLLLASNWWQKIAPLIEDPKLGAASGMRFASQPRGVMRLQQYVAKKYRGEQTLASWLRNRQNAAFTLGSTLDNTIYKTEVVRSVGGFPKLRNSAGVDTLLAYRLKMAGYGWAVDYNVQSVHLRGSLRHELKHQYWYGTQMNEIWGQVEKTSHEKAPISKFGIMYRFVISPFTGLFVAYKTREATIAYIHPLIRFYYLKGFLESGKRH